MPTTEKKILFSIVIICIVIVLLSIGFNIIFGIMFSPPLEIVSPTAQVKFEGIINSGFTISNVPTVQVWNVEKSGVSCE